MLGGGVKMDDGCCWMDEFMRCRLDVGEGRGARHVVWLIMMTNDADEWWIGY